jgi:hypothetical protein
MQLKETQMVVATGLQQKSSHKSDNDVLQNHDAVLMFLRGGWDGVDAETLNAPRQSFPLVPEVCLCIFNSTKVAGFVVSGISYACRSSHPRSSTC